MPRGPFLPSEFVSTQFSSAADKSNFGNTLLHFLDSDCPRELFTKKFYDRLSVTFGHIAHYVEYAIMRSTGRSAASNQRMNALSTPHNLAASHRNTTQTKSNLVGISCAGGCLATETGGQASRARLGCESVGHSVIGEQMNDRATRTRG